VELCGVVDPEQGGKKVLPRFTRESLRRRVATNAAKTCVAEAAAAVARAQADGNVTLKAAAHAYSVAATDLRDAYPEKQGDMHISFRAAAASYRATLASAKAVGDDAAVAQKLVEASEAFDVAAKAVVDAIDFDTKLEARGDLEDAEDAFEKLYKPYKPKAPTKPAPRKTAHRPRPTLAPLAFVQQTRRRVAGAPAEEAVWHVCGLPRRGVRQVQLVPRQSEARRYLHRAEVFNAEFEGAPPAS